MGKGLSYCYVWSRSWKADCVCRYQEGAKITNKRGWIGEEESTSEPESE